jgi:hypothetical protein
MSSQCGISLEIERQVLVFYCDLSPPPLVEILGTIPRGKKCGDVPFNSPPPYLTFIIDHRNTSFTGMF